MFKSMKITVPLQMCNNEDLFFHTSTKPESRLLLQSLTKPKMSITLKMSSVIERYVLHAVQLLPAVH